jgi:hypothetical protein
MNYQKPEVVLIGRASTTIQSTGKHGWTMELDQAQSPTAYEADE